MRADQTLARGRTLRKQSISPRRLFVGWACTVPAAQSQSVLGFSSESTLFFYPAFIDQFQPISSTPVLGRLSPLIRLRRLSRTGNGRGPTERVQSRLNTVKIYRVSIPASAATMTFPVQKPSAINFG